MGWLVSWSELQQTVHNTQYLQHWPPAGRVLLKPIFNSALNCCSSLPPSSLHTGLTFYMLAEKCLEWELEFINIVIDMETICWNVWLAKIFVRVYKFVSNSLFRIDLGNEKFIWISKFLIFFGFLNLGLSLEPDTIVPFWSWNLSDTTHMRSHTKLQLIWAINTAFTGIPSVGSKIRHMLSKKAHFVEL